MDTVGNDELMAELQLWDDRYREAESVMIEARVKRAELIVKLYENGVPQTHIAKSLQITQSSVNKVLSWYRKSNSGQ